MSRFKRDLILTRIKIVYNNNMFIDDVKIRVTAGDGGKGAVAFNKNMMSFGPVGGSGGKGGSIYIEGISDLNALNKFRFKKEIKAKNGQDGRSQFRDGSDAKDLVLPIPVGTVAHNLKTGEDIEINKIGQQVVIVRGGAGGRGNFHFRSSINTTPKEFEYGKSGEFLEIRFELKLIADVGFVGFPNVGKSSLLNKLTNAKSKVANYSFTTLEPNLGVYYELILADIPGLIEGASGGKGLGIKFLRHIERTKTLFYFISAQSAEPAKDYQVIQNELGAYNKKLLDKPGYIFLSKADLLDKDEVDKKLNELKAVGKEAVAISVVDDVGISRVEEILREIIKQKY